MAGGANVENGSISGDIAGGGGMKVWAKTERRREREPLNALA